MPATNLPVQTYSQGGNTRTSEVASDPTNGNVLASNNGTTTQVIATNTDSASRTITFSPPSAPLPFSAGVWQVTLTAGQKWASGPLPVNTFGTNPQFITSSALVTVASHQI